GEVFWLICHTIFLYRYNFCESTHSIRICLCIDLVTGLELPHSRTNPADNASEIIAQNQRQAARQNEFKLSVPDLDIHRVYAGGVYLNQNIILAQYRLWHFTSPYSVPASIMIDDECFHKIIVSRFLLKSKGSV